MPIYKISLVRFIYIVKICTYFADSSANITLRHALNVFQKSHALCVRNEENTHHIMLLNKLQCLQINLLNFSNKLNLKQIKILKTYLLKQTNKKESLYLWCANIYYHY